MDSYLVGGAVRDSLLDYPVVERDWVVVGATPQHMLDLGYQQVGKDFPVFLHPTSKEEYALARTERKAGHGYHGFEIDCAPQVTLEEDLARRDLTINAMAQTKDGAIIDPYGGQRDLAARVLRHVSDAFVEDPLRVLRTARFAARYHHLGFVIAPETAALMRDIVSADELSHLSTERIWVEFDRALGERNPEVFVETLRRCGALAKLLPALDALWGVPQSPQHHPEIDTGVHTLLALEQAVVMAAPRPVRFAVLLHDLGKGATPAAEWPRHIAHEHRGVPLVRDACKSLKAPGQYRDLALAVCAYHLLCHQAHELRGKTLLKLLKQTGGLRHAERWDQFLLACEADARGRKGFEQRDYPQAEYLRRARELAASVRAQAFAGQGIEGPALGRAIEARQTQLLDALREDPGQQFS